MAQSRQVKVAKKQQAVHRLLLLAVPERIRRARKYLHAPIASRILKCMELEIPRNKRLAEQFWVRHENGSDQMSEAQALSQERFPIVAILDRIRSAHNVGSIFRTSDGANIGRLLLCGYTPTPPHRHLEKTALGAAAVVPWQQHASALDAIRFCQSQGMQVLAAEKTASSVPLEDFALRFPVAIVLGNESDGLDQATIAACDGGVHLPMRGLKSSLNVSVAFGILAYELAARWEAAQPQSEPSESGPLIETTV